MHIRLPGRTIAAEIAAKSLRKAQTAIREAGAGNIVLVLQGRLIAGDVIAEAATIRSPEDQSWVGGDVCGGAVGSSTHEPMAYDPRGIHGKETI